QQPRELNLPPGGIEQIFTPNDEVHALLPVVDDDGKLVGPVAVAVACHEIAALQRRLLHLRTEAEIVEALDRRAEADTQAGAGRLWKVPVRARARISLALEVRS